MPREKPPCGNPLFLSWVEELRDTARERGTKAFETYSKAARSLAACPVTYSRPRELVCLTGIGPKTVGILEGKWNNYCEENGLPVPGESPAKRKGTAKSTSVDAATGGGSFFDNGSNPSNGSDAEPEIEPAPKKKRKAAVPKRYIPARGSGGYGILLSLVLAIDRPLLNTQVFLTKSEVIRGASSYCDSSYEHSEKGTYFTAWSNMKTLVGKGYVYVTGNPHKYCLTEEGYEVACAVRGLRSEFAHIEQTPFIYEPTDGIAGPSRLAMGSTQGATASPAPVAVPSRPRKSAEKFQFWYIDASGSRTSALGSAMVRLDPCDFINIRKLEFRATQRDHPFVSQLRLLDADTGSEGTIFAYIVEETAPPDCSRFEDEPPAKFMQGWTAEDDKDFVPFAGVSALARTSSAPDVPPGVTSNLVAQAAAHQVVTGPSRTQSASADFSLPSKRRQAPRLSSHIPLPSPLAEDDTLVSVPNFTPADAITFPAGSFEVILILDAREVESKTNRDKIGEALEAKGVKVETRALRLGDMCWIARRLDGLGGEEDEVVLDYVVERKRLDDLCSSIKDGRYNEQCFRLGNSCIRNVFYIVEDWQVAHNLEISGLQIMTAKSQIQVHNRFFLKETHRLSETIDWLVTMTGVITAQHNSILQMIPTRFLSRSSYSALQTHLRQTHPATKFLTSYQAYQDLNDKSASKTLREKFARMLMCVKGMSAERVSAVLDEFETPKAVWEAMKSREQEGQSQEGGESLGGKGKKKRGADMFFADRVKGEGRRKVGDALSKELWTALMGGAEVLV